MTLQRNGVGDALGSGPVDAQTVTRRLRSTLRAERFGLFRLADKLCLRELHETPDDPAIAAHSAYLGVRARRLPLVEGIEALRRAPASLSPHAAASAEAQLWWLVAQRDRARSVLEAELEEDPEQPILQCTLGGMLACAHDAQAAWARFTHAANHDNFPCQAHASLAYQVGIKVVGRRHAMGLFAKRPSLERLLIRTRRHAALLFAAWGMGLVIAAKYYSEHVTLGADASIVPAAALLASAICLAWVDWPRNHDWRVLSLCPIFVMFGLGLFFLGLPGPTRPGGEPTYVGLAILAAGSLLLVRLGISLRRPKIRQ